MKKLLVLAVTALTLSLVSVTPAIAETGTGDMQVRVEAVLAEYPGGEQTAWNEISWDDGAIVMTLQAAASSSGGAALLAAVGGCASGKFCAYNQTAYRGDKITYSTCASSQSVAALTGAVRSIANSRTSGTVRAYAGSTLLASAAAGAGASVGGTTTNISCG